MLVAVPVAEEDRLAAMGRVAPAPVPLIALIDTGASVSAIPRSVARALGVEPVDSMMVEGYDGVVQRQPVYEVRFFSAQDAVAMKVRVLGLADVERPIESVVGRDVLAQCRLEYDGFHGRFALAVLSP